MSDIYTAPPTCGEYLGILGGGDGLPAILIKANTEIQTNASGVTTNTADISTINTKISDAVQTDFEKLHDVTSSAAELNILTGVTSTAAELNVLDGITSTVTELNYTDGVTSAIQTQIDSKAAHTNGTITTPTIVTPLIKTAYAMGTVGATETVNWANGDLQTATLDENLTITFSNAAAGQRLTLFLLQDGSGTNTITWADTITWQDGITWGTSYYTTTANKMNVVVIYYSGSAYFGMVGKFA